MLLAQTQPLAAAKQQSPLLLQQIKALKLFFLANCSCLRTYFWMVLLQKKCEGVWLEQVGIGSSLSTTHPSSQTNLRSDTVLKAVGK